MVHNVDNLKKFVSDTNKQLDQLTQAIVNFKQAHKMMTKKEPTDVFLEDDASITSKLANDLEKVITSYDVTIATLKQCK